jgi:hypothetical protein
VPERIRTSGRHFRKLMLYPAELRALTTRSATRFSIKDPSLRVTPTRSAFALGVLLKPGTRRKARRPPRQGGVTLPRRHEDSVRRVCPQDMPDREAQWAGEVTTSSTDDSGIAGSHSGATAGSSSALAARSEGDPPKPKKKSQPRQRLRDTYNCYPRLRPRPHASAPLVATASACPA